MLSYYLSIVDKQVCTYLQLVRVRHAVEPLRLSPLAVGDLGPDEIELLPLDHQCLALTVGVRTHLPVAHLDGQHVESVVLQLRAVGALRRNLLARRALVGDLAGDCRRLGRYVEQVN